MTTQFPTKALSYKKARKWVAEHPELTLAERSAIIRLTS